MAVSDEASPIVVCDAGPIIHLDELGSRDLLGDFTRVLVPDAVWQEVTRHRADALVRAGIHFEKTAVVGTMSPTLEALTRLLSLHRGEQEALQVAQAEPGCLLLTDDTAARLAAQSLRLRVHGTIGILVRAIRRKQRTRDEVITLLRSLPLVSTLHVRQEFLEAIIRQVEQVN
jgi:predicted nucleic acid-binding protein